MAGSYEIVRKLVAEFPAPAAHIQEDKIWLNQAAIEMLGYTNEDIGTLSQWFKTLYRDKAEETKRLYENAKKSGFPNTDTVTLLTKDDKELSVQFAASCFDDNEIWVMSDSTAVKTQQKIISAQENFFESIVNNIPNMVFVKEAKDLRFTMFNKAGEDLLGVQNTDLIGKNDFDFFPEEQAKFFQEKDRAVLEGRTLVAIPEEPIDTPYGKRILYTQKIPLYDENGDPQFLLGISEDITETKEQEQKILYASKMASLGEMAAGIAHEINNPLAIIKGYARMMKKKVENDDFDSEGFKDLCDKIAGSTDRIGKIVKGLRSFSRDTTENDPKVDISIAKIIDETLIFCKEKLTNRGIDIQIAQVPDVQIECWPVQISQIILNLLNNAFDALEDQSDKWIKLEVIDNNDNIEISVANGGNPIPEELHAKIMQPFFTTKAEDKGTGLGLSVSRGFAGSHGGELKLDTNCDFTRFVLILPKKQTHESAA